MLRKISTKRSERQATTHVFPSPFPCCSHKQDFLLQQCIFIAFLELQILGFERFCLDSVLYFFVLFIHLFHSTVASHDAL